MTTKEKMVQLDGRGSLQVVSPVCTYCEHIIGIRRCKAFDAIPLEIWEGKNRHTSAYPGDNDTQFKAR